MGARPSSMTSFPSAINQEQNGHEVDEALMQLYKRLFVTKRHF